MRPIYSIDTTLKVITSPAFRSLFCQNSRCGIRSRAVSTMDPVSQHSAVGIWMQTQSAFCSDAPDWPHHTRYYNLVKWTGNRKLKTKQLKDSPVWYMSLSVSLRSVRQANTWPIHHETLFGLTDRLYEAFAVNVGLKYHQRLLKTYLPWSALFRLANSFTEPNTHLPYHQMKIFDAIFNCTCKAKLTRLGSIIRNTSTFKINNYVYCYRLGM